MQKSPTKPQIHKTMMHWCNAMMNVGNTRRKTHSQPSQNSLDLGNSGSDLRLRFCRCVCTCALLTRAHSTALAVNRTPCLANSAGDSESVPLPGNAPEHTPEFLYCRCWNLHSTTHAINEPRIRAQLWNGRDDLHWATYLLLRVPGISSWLFLFMFIRPFTYFFFFFLNLIIERDNLWKWLLLVLFNVCTLTINNPSSGRFWTKGH